VRYDKNNELKNDTKEYSKSNCDELLFVVTTIERFFR